MWKSEEKVLRALNQLPSPWRTFHSVAWQGPRNGRESDGEADFVLLHPELGIVVLEVKGGTIEVENGRWFSSNREGRYRIKNPFTQAKASKYTLIRTLKACGLERVPIVHAVAFPDGSVMSPVGMDGPRDIILDKADLTRPSESIERVIAHWKAKVTPPLSGSEVETIFAKLAPSARVAALLRDEVAVAAQALVELTERQLQVLSMSRRLQRLVVFGGAGTGKTVLAKERAIRFARAGIDTLLLCYNAPLADHVRRSLGDIPSLTVATFHAFCLDVVRTVGGGAPKEPSAAWWDREAAYQLVDASAAPGCPRFRALVLDEAQDFSPEWLDALILLLEDPDDDPVTCFADPHQELYPRGFVAPTGWPELSLDLNCRNTAPIAERVAAVFGETVQTPGAAGRAPVYHVAGGAPEQLRVTQRMVARMLSDEGLEPSQLAVLCDQRASVEWLRERMAGDVPFVALDEQGVVAETIQRFKGLEADVVICVLSGPGGELDRIRRLAYVGMSRAKAVLVVVGPAAIKRDLGW